MTDKKLEDALEWWEIDGKNWKSGFLDEDDMAHVATLSDAASRAQVSEDELNDYLERDDKGRAQIVRETVERCELVCREKEQDYLRDCEGERGEMHAHLLGMSHGAEGCADAIQALTPEQSVCEWEWKGDGQFDPKGWHTSCGHLTAKYESWEFCPFKGCGRPIKVKE